MEAADVSEVVVGTLPFKASKDGNGVEDDAAAVGDATGPPRLLNRDVPLVAFWPVVVSAEDCVDGKLKLGFVAVEAPPILVPANMFGVVDCDVGASSAFWPPKAGNKDAGFAASGWEVWSAAPFDVLRSPKREVPDGTAGCVFPKRPVLVVVGVAANKLELACIEGVFVADPDGLLSPKSPPLDCIWLLKGFEVAAEDDGA